MDSFDGNFENLEEDDNEEEWIYDADEWDEWFTRSQDNVNEEFALFTPQLPPLPLVHSRVRRQVPQSRLVTKDFDPKEVIHAYRESFTPVMIFTVIIFWLVVLVLPLLFTAEYIFIRPERRRRNRKVHPEDQEHDSTGLEPEDIDYFRSATQSTQLALGDDDDDIMKDVRPDELQFTIIAQPRRFSLPQDEEPRSSYDTAEFGIHAKPSKQPAFQPPRRSDPLNPTVVRVPTALRVSYEDPERNADKGRKPQEDSQAQLHPLTLARQNLIQGLFKPYGYNEEDVTIQRRPKKGEKLVKLTSVQSQTSKTRIPILSEKPQSRPYTKSKPNPNNNNPIPTNFDLEDNSPLEDFEPLEREPMAGTSRDADEHRSSKSGRKKCEAKVLVGNSNRFQSGAALQKKKKPNKDLKAGCGCPYNENKPSHEKPKFKDLTWFQILEYAQADGGWFESDKEEVQENQEEEDNESIQNKDRKKKDKKHCRNGKE